MGEPNVAAHGRVCRNAASVLVETVPTVTPEGLRQAAVAAVAEGGRIAALFALPRLEGGGHDVHLVIAHDEAGNLEHFRASLATGDVLPSLTGELPQAQAFERELHEQHGIEIAGHPWLKPLRGHSKIAKRSADTPIGASHPFFQVSGAGIHEVAVGPVHAGVIEPGHFRFQCAGEQVLSLEIHLGYQHRGLEALLLEGSASRRLPIAESIAGDTAIGHGLAHTLALEGLTATEPPAAAEAVRGIALELERLANHVGDLGAMAGDVGYLPGASYFGRLRGNLLNLLMELSGNRFGRGLLKLGGVRFGLDEAMGASFLGGLASRHAELRQIAHLLFETPSGLARFEDTGVVTEQAARELGLVGPVCRASGVSRDVRADHPTGIFRSVRVAAAGEKAGDVLARASIRWEEVQRSLTFVQDAVKDLPRGPLSGEVGPMEPNRIAVALVEGWRGEIVHVAVTGEGGQLRGYKIVDPSFHNWFGLAMALRGEQISDFPLCNKSFNLSYAGHDL
jgi:Ni,Fe-hydrogenase III large subunit